MRCLRVILDTNFLTIPGKFGVDIFSEMKRILDQPFELFVLQDTLKELDGIKGKDQLAAKIAKTLIKTKNINIIAEKHGYVDDILAEMSREPDTVVASADFALVRRLEKAIYLRQKKYLEKKNVL